MYYSNLIIDLPHKPGMLGEITSIIGINDSNIINVDILKENKNTYNFHLNYKLKI